MPNLFRQLSQYRPQILQSIIFLYVGFSVLAGLVSFLPQVDNFMIPIIERVTGLTDKHARLFYVFSLFILATVDIVLEYYIRPGFAEIKSWISKAKGLEDTFYALALKVNPAIKQAFHDSLHDYSQAIGSKLSMVNPDGDLWASILNPYLQEERTLLSAHTMMTDVNGYVRMLTTLIDFAVNQFPNEIIIADITSTPPIIWFDPESIECYLGIRSGEADTIARKHEQLQLSNDQLRNYNDYVAKFRDKIMQLSQSSLVVRVWYDKEKLNEPGSIFNPWTSTNVQDCWYQYITKLHTCFDDKMSSDQANPFARILPLRAIPAEGHPDRNMFTRIFDFNSKEGFGTDFIFIGSYKGTNPRKRQTVNTRNFISKVIGDSDWHCVIGSNFHPGKGEVTVKIKTGGIEAFNCDTAINTLSLLMRYSTPIIKPIAK